MIAIGFFNHSSADDYSFGLLAHLAFAQGGGISDILSGAFQTVVNNWLGWQGTFSAILLFSLQPAVFGEGWYWVSSLVLIGSFLLSLRYLVSSVAVRLDGTDRRVATIVFCIAALLSTQLCPSPVQAFYWWNGSMYYTFFYALLMVFGGQLLRWLHDWASWRLIALCALGFFIGGGNYLTALWAVELSLTAIVMAGLLGGRRQGLLAGAIFVCTTFAFLLSVMAPGNAVRQMQFVGSALPPLKAIFYSFHYAVLSASDYLGPILLIALLFLWPFLMRIPMVLKCRTDYVFIAGLCTVFVVAVGMYISSFAPTLYGMGTVGDGRVQDIRYYFFVALCILCEAMLCQIAQRSKLADQDGKERKTSSVIARTAHVDASERYGVMIAFVAAALGIVCVISLVLPGNWNSLTSVSALRSLITGEATTYRAENVERDRLLTSENVGQVILEPYSSAPSVLFFEDFSSDPEYWSNDVACDYFGKDSIAVRPAGENAS